MKRVVTAAALALLLGACQEEKAETGPKIPPVPQPRPVPAVPKPPALPEARKPPETPPVPAARELSSPTPPPVNSGTAQQPRPRSGATAAEKLLFETPSSAPGK